MQPDPQPFISLPFLRRVWFAEYEQFRGSDRERALVARLQAWADRTDQKETSAEGAFVTEFFERTWGYWAAGQRPSAEGYTAVPKFALPGAGQGGGTGEADLALGWFGRPGISGVPQVLCEFKDIRSRLDQPQRRKGNQRSPVKQAADYLAAARRGLFGNEPVVPSWAIVSDMNEFRLYWWDRMPHQYVRFVIRREELFHVRTLLDEDEECRFERFLFARLFHRDILLSAGGPCLLLDMIRRQRFREREIEDQFYKEYRDYRLRLYNLLRTNNPDFPGTLGQLVRIAQTILDRCLFVLYCEDMGREIDFPPQLLRDFLIERSNDRYYDGNGREIWDGLRRLFQMMDRGGSFGPGSLFAFNGGLFRHDPRLDALTLPNDAFCEKGQGANQASVEGRINLLYLAAAYNFAAKADGSHSLSLYTLGRIFEQSITELEILEAEVEGRESIGKVSKRKRDGVYYTPEWVVEVVVEETLGRRLQELRLETGWIDGLDVPTEVAAIQRYLARLRAITVLDPACGSGAFLIGAVRRLLEEREFIETRLLDLGSARKVQPGAVLREVLTRNIYGLDINAASVEITQLSLWLHTARRDEPLTVLDEHIQWGNSLIDSRFYEKRDLLGYSEADKERVKVFDWKREFPDVFARGGFDVVIGNPPYVKLQNFRKVHADMAEYLRNGSWHGISYESTQTGNFDLYLPFIEKGLHLLNEQGRLGFIAPSLWTKNDYGQGLRDLVRRGRHLDRWIDFEAYQVFDEAITYTALQFYTRRPNTCVAVFRAPNGPEDLPRLDWQETTGQVPYDSLTANEPWLLLPEPERRLIERLRVTCRRLDDPELTRGIVVGLQTSADEIYHLQKLGAGVYRCRPRGQRGAAFEVHLEDAIMHPLVSGPEAKRYERPRTDTYILFPYEMSDGRVRLIPPERMERHFPRAWAYLQRWEQELRRRENNSFDDGQWYRFGRNQNLDKQKLPKLIVPRLVVDLKTAFDADGQFFLDNVDVGGVIPQGGIDGSFLCGVLNGAVCSWAFHRISKPFQGNFRSANKQFIAPLPIPFATPAQQARVAGLAGELQMLTTRRRDWVLQLERRIETAAARLRPDTWLWSDLGNLDHWLAREREDTDTRTRERQAREAREADVNRRIAEIKQRFLPGAEAEALLSKGELIFRIGGQAAIDRVFVDASEAELVLAQWRQAARSLTITERTNARSLTQTLRRLVVDPSSAAARQILDLDRQIEAADDEIARLEAEMEELRAELYGLSDEERRLVAQS
jgi:hypothetical protein